ncbi:MAG: GDP-L-fucose synthase [Alphaproteobacteria bacterium]|nr:GDP-L-fucose synthase [Alphaproteobacteria bacterium]
MTPESRIYVAGHRGLVGSAILRALRDGGFRQIVTRPRAELDLMSRKAVDRFFERQKPEYVFLAAAKVGGIHANATQPADFLYENLTIQNNVINAAKEHDVRKLLFLGSSCIYPKLAPQPIKEDYLLTGLLEPTNQAYALAKIAGLEMCRAYRRQYDLNAICLMPTNLYGPRDNFDLEAGHVVPALMRRAHEAKLDNAAELMVWGTGRPRREFMHVNDLADAAIFLMREYDDEAPINVGVGADVTIRELAQTICEVVGFTGRLAFDLSKPDGTPQKLLDVTRLTDLGWTAGTALRVGLAETYAWYLKDGGARAG